ncbi:MAG: lamin tail domain-containing protein [Myxococcales bacterium]|nr:lamin tail domain-containing protein [Myxococcales bacterium]
MSYFRASSIVLAAGLAFAGCNGDDAVTSDTAGTESDSDTGTSGSTSIASTSGTSTTSTTSPETTGSTTDTSTTDTSTTDVTATGTTTSTTTTTDTDTTTTTTTTTDTDTTTTTSTTGGVDDTIYDIQMEVIAVDSPVDVQGVIVTGKGASGVFVQEPPGGQYSGAWVYAGGLDIAALELGDEVDIIGVHGDFNGLTEIDASGGSITATGNKGLLPDPELVVMTELADPITAEPWEGVLIRVEGMPLGVVAEPGFDEFVVNDGVDDLYVDDQLYNIYMNPLDFPNFAVGGSFTAINGPLNFTFDNFKIAPRMTSDLEGYMEPMQLGVGVDDLLPGDLIISEIMFNPTCAGDPCEWIEVYNTAGVDVNLMGLRIQDSQFNPNAQGVISDPVILAPGDYAWLGRGTVNAWPYMTPADAHYGANPALNNGGGGDLVAILNTNEILDQTANYLPPMANTSGISLHLMPGQLDALANDDLANWCYSTIVYDSPLGVDEYGTPGAANEMACAML